MTNIQSNDLSFLNVWRLSCYSQVKIFCSPCLFAAVLRALPIPIFNWGTHWKISDFCHKIDEICAFLGCYTVYSDDSSQMFRGKLWPFKLLSIGFLERSVKNYTLPNIPEECGSHWKSFKTGDILSQFCTEIMDFSIYGRFGILHLVSVDHITDLSEEVSAPVVSVKLKLNRQAVLRNHVKWRGNLSPVGFLCHISEGNAVFIFSLFLKLKYHTGH